MDYGKRLHDWDVGASIIAMIQNVNVTKKSDAVSPEDIHPMRKPREVKKLSPRESVRAIAEAWGISPPGDEQCPPLVT